MTHVTQQFREGVGVPLTVCGHNFAHGVVGLRELGGSIDEGATAESGTVDLSDHGGDEVAQCKLRSGCGGDECFQLRAYVSMAMRDVLDDQVVFRAVVLIKRCLRDRRRADNPVNADVADTVFVEENVHRIEDAAFRRSALCRWN